jgi:hypothetical protein
MTNEQLEQSIGEIGRDKVFSFIEENGWSRNSTPPFYVWELAIMKFKTLQKEDLETKQLTHINQ